VAIAWGVMQHFYPYFDVVETDWDEALTSALRKAAEDEDEKSYLHTLQALIAQLHDGHGNVFKVNLVPRYRIPFNLQWAGDDCVVVGKGESVPSEVELGDAITSIDSEPLETVCQALATRISAATDGFRRYRLLRLLTSREGDDDIDLVMRKPDGSEYKLSLPPVRVTTRIEDAIKRPGDGSQLADGIVYFDLCGAKADALAAAFEKLKSADGIVFDLRGYPADAAYNLLTHLIKERAASAQWNIPMITMPDGEHWTWHESAWDMRPSATPLEAEIAFLTDGRAISYAESIMGIVEHYRLGEIVGATTAGTNGNVNPFSLHGGYNVSWTGMRVLKHDGSQHHGIGIVPTVPIHPSAQGIAEGRDEVLEKAIAVLQQNIQQNQ